MKLGRARGEWDGSLLPTSQKGLVFIMKNMQALVQMAIRPLIVVQILQKLMDAGYATI